MEIQKIQEIQEIKINGITYVPADTRTCEDCSFKAPQCVRKLKFNCEVPLCSLFGKALKIKED